MRLLHTRRWEFREFYDDDIPDYAILSHRWEEDELTYQDARSRSSHWWQSEVISLTKGERKVLEARKQADSDGYEWIWIDTCAIDKSSSAELGEAINSMFGWYERSKVCYAYLSDVCSLYEFDFSQWFKRGWTLQELLTPKSIEFFGTRSDSASEWLYLGRKADEEILDKIVRTTGIPKYCLKYSSFIRSEPVAVRMSWASFRKTSRVEDLAYCLLGLFDVNMPLIYGEGRKAFCRLQEEIIKATDDESIFAHNGFGSTVCSMLADDPVNFSHARNIRRGMPKGMRQMNASSKPYTMTNKGLQMCLPYIEIEHPEPFRAAVLNCSTKASDLPYIVTLRRQEYFHPPPRWERFGWSMLPEELDAIAEAVGQKQDQVEAEGTNAWKYEWMYIK